jgi:hypothetical protein
MVYEIKIELKMIENGVIVETSDTEETYYPDIDTALKWVRSFIDGKIESFSEGP